jgi:Abnormal spindle-like microcephaly-assoc'd, ASPM-SPD-2-Hydin
MLQLAWGINWELIPAYGNPSLAFSGPATSTWYNTNAQVDWTLSDAGSGGFPAPGVAGFTQGWDSIPADPYSEPHSGDDNSFYSGPQYAFAVNGCLAFVPNGCAGGASQGCHTVQVEGWDNEGRTTFGSYGPLCYDTIPPVTKAGLSGTLISGTTYKSAVTVTLSASDPGYPSTGSGVAATYYYLNSGGWQFYSGPFAVSYAGSYTVHFESLDNAGNYETAKSTSFTIKPVLSLSPASLAFGNEVLGTTSAGKAVTVTNITSSSVPISSIAASGDFTITANTCPATLAGSGHCSITVAFKPSVLGAVTGDVTIVYSAIGSSDRLGLSGTGVAPLTASPTSLSFGTVTVGTTSVAKTVTLKNDNPSTPLSLSFSANGDYSAVAGGGTPCGATLAGGASCTVNVTFKPHQNGTINGAVTVKDGVSLSPLVVGLTGSGSGGVVAPLTFTPTSLSYTNAVVGTNTAKTVTVKNTSASSVTVSSVSASGDYSASGCVTTLTSGATCTLTVTFSPSTSGTTKGAIALTDTTSVSPEVLDASGTAVLPVTVSPTSVSFGAWTVGTTSGSHTVTLTNHTAGSTSIAFAASGDFSAAAGGGTPCGVSLGAGASCTFVVTFSPTTTGAVSGVATVTYSAGFSPQEVKLSGTGQ